VIVEAKPGASGRIAAMELKNAAPDGNSIALFPIAVPVLNPLTLRDVRYEPTRDFVAVTQIATYTLALAVPYDLPVKSMSEFIAWMKAHPAQAYYGTGGEGSLPHFLGVMIGKTTGAEMNHVPYKGPAPMMIALVSGVIPAGISGVSDLIEMHKAGKVRIIATSGSKRLAQLPDVPTFVEQGYPIQAQGWIGVFAPAKTPEAVIDKWSATLVAAVRSRDISDQLTALGLEPTGTSPAEFASIVAADIELWKPIVKLSGFRAE
jgi:tripartite-type tricarboxylate transporter receptor subunit TctC